MPTSQSPSNEETLWVRSSPAPRPLCVEGLELLRCRTYPAPPATCRAVPLPPPPRAAPCPALPGGSSHRPICALVGALGSFELQKKHPCYSAISTTFSKALICLIFLCKSYLAVSINFSGNKAIAEFAAVNCVAFFCSCSVCLWANLECPMSVNGSIY